LQNVPHLFGAEGSQTPLLYGVCRIPTD